MTPGRLARAARRVAGGGILVLTLLPVHRLLVPARAGPAGASTAATAEATLSLALLGTAALLAAALVLGAVIPLRRLEPALSRARLLLLSPGDRLFALALSLLTLVLGLAVALGVHRGLPRLLDAMTQLLHARYMAEGMLAGPLTKPAARLVQNSLLADGGWASVYPPGHTALLAVALRLGAVRVMGPLLLCLAAPLLFLTLRWLYPTQPGVVRLTALVAALSPFVLFLGADHLSHVSAMAGGVAAFYLAVRAWRGQALWAVAAGAAMGYMVTARPWTGLVLGGFLTFGVWAAAWWRDGRPVSWLARRAGAGALGGLPFAMALAWYNRSLFGAATRFGYEAAFGPAHGLGFHRDPWGNLYGLREALGYTGADVVTLGLHLFETPLPAGLAVGLFLLVAPRLHHATRILVGWAVIPLLANALYWHHGQHMGPRMLFEAAPAWAALTVMAVVGLVRGGRDPGLPGVSPRTGASHLAASVALWAALLAVPAGALLLLPARVESYRWPPDQLARTIPPTPVAGGPAIVFVHGTWANRVGSRLAATGMRRDSVETALRRNDLCRVHLYARARAGRSVEPSPSLDFEPLPGTPGTLELRSLAPGERIRVDPTRAPDPACRREARSDRLGVVELAPLLWQTSLPGRRGAVLLYRDLGPRANTPLLTEHPERTPFLYAPRAPGEPPVLIPYETGMQLLWGTE